MPRTFKFQRTYTDDGPIKLPLDEEAIERVRQSFPRFASTLDAALHRWVDEGIPVRRLSDGVTGDADADNIVKFEPSGRGCCLLGAARIGLVWSQFLPGEPVHYGPGSETPESFARRFGAIREGEVSQVRVGFDGFNVHTSGAWERSQTYEAGRFGFAVAEALHLPPEDDH